MADIWVYDCVAIIYLIYHISYFKRNLYVRSKKTARRYLALIIHPDLTASILSPTDCHCMWSLVRI